MSKTLKAALIGEALLANIYLPLTNGIFLVYVASLGYDIKSMSHIIAASSLPAVLIGLISYKRPNLFKKENIKKRFITVHAGERLLWLLAPFLRNLEHLLLLYTLKNFFSSLISLQLNQLIYGSFGEEDVRDVTAKRSSAASASSILGYFLATTFLSMGDKGFTYSFIYGSLIGLASTALMAFPELKIKGRTEPTRIREVEKIYTVSLYQIFYIASANLLSVLWVYVLVSKLGLPAYWAATVSLVGTATSIISSLLWGRLSFKYYKISLALDSITPILVFIIGNPFIHLGLSSYNSLFSTGSGFLGGFLYARYLGNLGPSRAAFLLISLSGLGQLLAALLGSFVKEDYVLLALSVILFKFSALVVAYLAIPEVAIVPGHMARGYASTLFQVSVSGYRLTLEISWEAVLMTLRIIVLTFSLLILYVIYRLAVILVGV
ncbi:MAG: hypothetical protein DRJ37_00155 [Thermoprotei archaeon]|nr:MAG: hypothetical protein DRJ37_00155 [Thermoprotei archaeon]